MIYGFIIFAVTITIDLITDYRLWLKKKPVKHLTGALLRLIGLVPAAYLLGWKSIPMLLFCYAAIFDTLIGMAIASDGLFLGTTSALDRLQHKYPLLQILKYVFAVGSTILYVVLA